MNQCPIRGVSVQCNTALFGYARVSTLDQDPRLQHDALDSAGCERIWTDVASGSLDQRPELANLVSHLSAGDVVVVWRLDRLGRSIRHLIQTMGSFDADGVQFRSLTEGIDTTTPTGRLVFHMFAALAEFERDLIRERTMAGLAAARARGRMGGRPRRMTPDKVRIAREMYDSREYTMAAIAKTLEVSRSTLYLYLKPSTNIPEGEKHGTK